MKHIITHIILGTLLLLVSCNKKALVLEENSFINLDIKTSNQSTPRAFNSQFTHKNILVVLGYDFNTPNISSNFIELLQNLYGISESNGIIRVITFPGDFKRGIRGYVSELTAILTDLEVEYAGVIILGAPENTHIALAHHQDFWNQMVPYPVISLFPQDDVLGIEATCDIVIEKAQTLQLDVEPISEELENLLIEEAPNLLIQTINYLLDMNQSNTLFERNESLKIHLKQMYPNFQFHNYSDPETGLQSINHFILN